ncbi:hypothetical protein WJ966_02410 [Achromobacter xylosoxidans]
MLRDAARWTPVLDRLCGEVGTLSAVVQCIELDGARAVPYWAAYDSRIDMAAYRSEVSDASNPRFDSWRLRRVASRPGRIATDHELFLPGETAIRDRLHAQLRRAGLGRFMGAMAPLGATAMLPWCCIATRAMTWIFRRATRSACAG